MIDLILTGIFSAILGALSSGAFYALRFSNHLGEIKATLEAINKMLETTDKRIDGIERRLERLESK